MTILEILNLFLIKTRNRHDDGNCVQEIHHGCHRLRSNRVQTMTSKVTSAIIKLISDCRTDHIFGTAPCHWNSTNWSNSRHCVNLCASNTSKHVGFFVIEIFQKKLSEMKYFK